MPDLTWFMWGNMVIEATKPSVDRCWYELIGSCGFFGKGLLDCEKYIVKVIGTPEKLIEALPVDIMSNPNTNPTPTPAPTPTPTPTPTPHPDQVDIMSHDTPEGFLLRPCFADHVTMEEEPARNFITFESQVRLRARVKGEGSG